MPASQQQKGLLQSIRRSVIGESTSIQTAFGKKPLVYADYTASGRALSTIESFIQNKVLPFYANTHTETSFTGAQTTKLREQARAQIAEAINADDEFAVIFCGAGATAAIDKLISILGLRIPSELDDKYQFSDTIPNDERPVIFIGPYEHHSNELPWRESIADVVSIPLTEDGLLDHAALVSQLKLYAKRPLKIGSFSAASNVTGIKTEVDTVSAILHAHGALSFWDYAAASPYVAINMQGGNSELGDCAKDAVFISPHKFVGGPGTPGLLVVRRSLLQNKVPAVSGGGTVMYVTPEDHQYIKDEERREEGGTPAIVESIRAGLVFKLQQAVGTELIEELERQFISQAINRLQKNPNIRILGNTQSPRLSILSFQVMHEENELHYNFVVALLNDLFGIQARGGCSCAGPYGHSLLDLDLPTSKKIEAQLEQGHMILRPGWVRVNFNYFIDQATFEHILAAVEMIAEYGWRLLPLYEYDADKGVWHKRGHTNAAAVSLHDIDFFNTASVEPVAIENSQVNYAQVRAEALQVLRQYVPSDPECCLKISAESDALRRFVLPQEVNSTAEV